MTFVLNAFLNPWMLAGLTGILLPVISHLISRKKYDLVEWGAMQFLELDPSAKRKIRLEELLLLLVRIFLIGLLAVALARPWIGSNWLGRFASTEPRDVVLIIDGSYSMGWDGNADGKTPHARSLQIAREFLGALHPADAVQIIDAREHPHFILPDLTRDAYRAKEAVNDLSAPLGSADLAAALRKAVPLLALGTNLQREIIVLTDLQASSWKADDEESWTRFEDVRSQSPIAPRVWVIDTSRGELGRAPNFAIERLQLSKEMAIIGVPVRIRTRVVSFSDESAVRKVHLEIDEVRLEDQAVQIKIPAKGETSVDFQYRFETPGSHLISLVLDSDALSGDNRAEAVVSVIESIPILMVDGDRNPDPTKCETFFARAALFSAGEEKPWISPTVIEPDELTADRLKSVSLAMIANVASLNASATEALQQFAQSGHGVLFALGDKVDRDHYRSSLFAAGKGILPCQLDSLENESGNEKRGVRVLTQSLQLPWLQPFRPDRGGTLGEARWSHWWKVTPAELQNTDGIPLLKTEELNAEDPAAANQSPDQIPVIGPAIVEARLTTGDPLIVSRRLGFGTTAVLTSSLDADWNSLPAKQDYVPLLHELLFSLTSQNAARNVDVDAPLILKISPEWKIDDFQFLNPVNKAFPPEEVKNSFQSTVRLRNTTIPGVYRLVRKKPKPNQASPPEYFVVNFDRAESDVTPLTEAQRDSLSRKGGLKFVSDLPDLRKNMVTETSRFEIWWPLLYLFLGGLAVEAWMTRRMVQGDPGIKNRPTNPE